jgi:hypothetical protein
MKRLQLAWVVLALCFVADSTRDAAGAGGSFMSGESLWKLCNGVDVLARPLSADVAVCAGYIGGIHDAMVLD